MNYISFINCAYCVRPPHFTLERLIISAIASFAWPDHNWSRWPVVPGVNKKQRADHTLFVSASREPGHNDADHRTWNLTKTVLRSHPASNNRYCLSTELDIAAAVVASSRCYVSRSHDGFIFVSQERCTILDFSLAVVLKGEQRGKSINHELLCIFILNY